MAAAEAFLAPYLKSPTHIAITTPLTKRPPAGKLIIGLNDGGALNTVLADYWKQAVEAIGWKYKEVNVGVTPETQQQGVATAIGLNPAGILGASISAVTIKAQLAQAKSKGIFIGMGGTTDPSSGALIGTQVNGVQQNILTGKIAAAEMVINSKGTAKILQFTIPGFPNLELEDSTFAAAVKQWCPACTIKTEPQQATAIGVTTPGAVVSALQANPSTNWLYFDVGDLDIGVPAALTAARLGSGVSVGGLTGSQANVAAIKAGTEKAWTEISFEDQAFMQVDSMARKIVGDPQVNAAVVEQLADAANVNTPGIFTAQDEYVGLANIPAQYEKLWLVG